MLRNMIGSLFRSLFRNLFRSTGDLQSGYSAEHSASSNEKDVEGPWCNHKTHEGSSGRRNGAA